MRRLTNLILCLTIFFYTPVFASAKAQPLTLGNIKSAAKPFVTAQNFYQLTDAMAPELRTHTKQWIEFFAKNHVNLKALPIEQLRVEGNSLFIGDNPTPFEYRNDGKTFAYNGVAVTFEINEKPEVTFAKMQKAWGQFRELGLSQKKTAGLKDLFLPQANAQNANEAQAFAAGASLMAVLGMVVYLGALYGIKAVAAIMIAAIGISSLGFIALIVAVAYLDKKFHNSSSFMGLELVCNKGVGELHDLSAQEPAVGPRMDSNSVTTQNALVQYPEEQRQRARTGFNKICEAGPEAVKRFNDAVFMAKAKIRNGELGGFVPVGDPAASATTKPVQ